ncbi:unnamed protein product [Pseudo-nitzschia multistriata]|uniref:Uncharacterized protein n=1 Tax=Pseudo-nitzschia multistriata TaxID=183589 RepID=A0A448ZCE0_9STRA|nr:unnamed protein product [Pseudo-nitzschia multistriata]
MHFFQNRNRPRSSFELKVGKSHLLEVTVHLVTRRRDVAVRRKVNRNPEWDWYNTNKDDIHREFLELLEASVLSRMFGDEIEGYHRKKNPSVMEGNNGEMGFGKVGSKNRVIRSKGNGMASGTRKRKGTTVPSNSKKHKVFLETNNDGENNSKPEKDIYFSFGELIQLAYKKEPIKDDRSSRTIIFESLPSKSNRKIADGHNGNSETITRAAGGGTFLDRQKLSHRLLVWIGKSEAAASAGGGHSHATAAEGMYRNEMVPISSLFRKPPEFVSLSDDDDGD